MENSLGNTGSDVSCTTEVKTLNKMSVAFRGGETSGSDDIVFSHHVQRVYGLGNVLNAPTGSLLFVLWNCDRQWSFSRISTKAHLEVGTLRAVARWTKRLTDCAISVVSWAQLENKSRFFVSRRFTRGKGLS